MIITTITKREEIMKLKNVKVKLWENSLIREDRLMLNAPSNNKNSKANVVKIGAI